MTTNLINNNRLLANRYQLLDLVGKGAMGQVYQAKDMLLGGVTVAVKFLSQARLNQKTRDRFAREATICALLGEKSINIVRVRDYGVDEMETPFYVMEYLQGESLKNIIKRQPLPLPRFLSISRQICLGLQFAHQGIVIDGTLCPIIHRDIKSSNIFVVGDATLGELVKLIDFGISQLQSDDNSTSSFMGTLAYCSPEQTAGKQLDGRSDIYSLGVLMFEMLTGEIPIKAETHSLLGWYKAHQEQPPKSLKSVKAGLKVPDALEELVMSCLAKAPEDRPQSAVEVLQALETLASARQCEQIAQAEVTTKSKPPVTADANPKIDPWIDEICRSSYWPKDKPQAEIVFPHILRTSREDLATLWVMLPQQEIENHQFSNRYNQFLCLMSPHPMALWITAVHNSKHGPRWLPCYLDLKTFQGQEMAQLLAKTGSYLLLFFALEEPAPCAQVMSSTIAPAQRQLLQEWVNTSHKFGSAAARQTTSKKLLKQEFEKLKPQILMKLEAIQI